MCNPLLRALVVTGRTLVRGRVAVNGSFREGGQGLEFGAARKSLVRKKERDLWVTSGRQERR